MVVDQVAATGYEPPEARGDVVKVLLGSKLGRIYTPPLLRSANLR